jgi:hypothetical protein
MLCLSFLLFVSLPRTSVDKIGSCGLDRWTMVFLYIYKTKSTILGLLKHRLPSAAKSMYIQ